MAQINRGSLPQNFLDSVSAAGLRLPAPEPQYFFAKMAMGARLRLNALNAGAPTAQQFVSMAGGGEMVSPELAEMARAADAYEGAVVAVDQFGLGKGDSVKFTRDQYLDGTFTEASRELAQDSAISTTGQSIKGEEVSVTLKEFVGPHDGSSIKPYGISNFDAMYKANKEQLTSIVSRHLRRDYIKWLDTAVRDRFRSPSVTSNITYADAVTNVLSFTLGAGHVLSLETVMNARKAISDREWSKFSNGRYMLLVPTKFNTDMVGDPDYRELSKTHDAGKNLLYGYIGSVQDVDIFEVSTLKQYAAADTTADGNAVPASVTVQESLLIGPGAVGLGTALPPEARWADDTNFGTVGKCIWYALHAFQTLDVRGVQRILSQ